MAVAPLPKIVAIRPNPITDAEVAVLLEALSRLDQVRAQVREKWLDIFNRMESGAIVDDGYLTGLLRISDEIIDGGRRRVLLINERRPEEI